MPSQVQKQGDLLLTLTKVKGKETKGLRVNWGKKKKILKERRKS